MKKLKAINIALMTSSLFLFLGCQSLIANRQNKNLSSCFEYSENWEIFPGHFYDKEVHLVPLFPEKSNSEISVKSPAKGRFLGYSVVYIKEGSVYEDIGLMIGDTITSIDGIVLAPTNHKALTLEQTNLLKKIKEGKGFTLQRCLQPSKGLQ